MIDEAVDLPEAEEPTIDLRAPAEDSAAPRPWLSVARPANAGAPQPTSKP